jgi:hypothetical protein
LKVNIWEYTFAYFLLGSQLSGALKQLLASCKNFFNRVTWPWSTCFFMVVMPLDLWYTIGPF